MGLFGAAFGLGFVIGPALGAGLAVLGTAISGEDYGTAWPAFGATVIALVALGLAWRFLPESRPDRPTATARFRGLHMAQLREALSHPRLRELFVLVFSSIFAFVLLEVSFVYLCAHRFGVAEAGTGMIFAYIGVLMVFVQGGLVGRLAGRHGEAWLVAIGPFITALGFLMLSAVPLSVGQTVAWMLLILGCVPVALGHGLTGPSLNALVSRQAHEERQGMTLGLSQGIGSLARAIGPIVGGLLYDAGPSWPYWAGAAVLVCVGLTAIRVRPQQERSLAADDVTVSAPNA
jgi:MFS family permease